MISKNLLILRKRAGYSQEEVAEKIGVSRQAVGKWESGESMPDVSNCAALAQLYEVTLDDLVNYDEHTSQGLPIPPQGKHVFGTVTIGEKGQIVIPVKARKVFGLKPGDTLLVLGDEMQGIALLKSHFFLDMLENYNLKKEETE